MICCLFFHNLVSSGSKGYMFVAWNIAKRSCHNLIRATSVPNRVPVPFHHHVVGFLYKTGIHPRGLLCPLSFDRKIRKRHWGRPLYFSGMRISNINQILWARSFQHLQEALNRTQLMDYNGRHFKIRKSKSFGTAFAFLFYKMFFKSRDSFCKCRGRFWSVKLLLLHCRRNKE